MEFDTNFYEADQSFFKLPTVTNNGPCGLRAWVQNESGWCELRCTTAKGLTPVPLTDVEWNVFHALVKIIGKDLPKPKPKPGWDYSKGIDFV